MHGRACCTLILAVFLFLVTLSVPGAQAAPPFQTKWGSQGTGDGQFMGPHGVAVGPSGHVYVVEFYGHRVQKFTSVGAYVLQWGELGGGEGQFNSPAGVAVDADGNVYVTSFYSHNVQKFTSDGTFITRWGTAGTNDGEFQYPFGIAIDAAGDVLVADMLNGRIQKFTNTGSFIMKFGSMAEAQNVAVDGLGFIYVTDSGNHVVNKYASDGTFVTSWGGYGSGNGQFWTPSGIAVDPGGIVYVSELNNNRVQMFQTDGSYLDQWGTYGTGDGQFDGPQGLALHTNGSVYVGDSRNHRIQVFGLIPVPVTLAYLAVDRVHEDAVVRWRVNEYASDANDVRFDVYRRVEGGRMLCITNSSLSGAGELKYVDRKAPTARTDYWVEEIAGGSRHMHGPTTLAALEPASLAVGPNHPNPFNPTTTIRFTVPEAGAVRLAVYDARGSLVKVLEDAPMAAGAYETLWDGRNQAGESVASGVYFARIDQMGRYRTHKLLLLK